MPAPTKASMARQAQAVVDALAAFETALAQAPSDINTRNWSSSGVSFVLSPFRAPTILTVLYYPHHHSNHTVMAIEVWKRSLIAPLSAAAAAMAEMFPGMEFTLRHRPADENEQARFELFLGASAKDTSFSNKNCAIDTVLSRWKAPLIRLSQFLALEQASPAPHLYAFAPTTKTSRPTGVLGDALCVFVPAHTPVQAMAVQAFLHADSTATPSPQLNTSDAILQVRDPQGLRMDAASWQTTLHTACNTHPLRTVPKEMEDQAEALATAFQALRREHHSTITYDLVQGVAAFAFHDHPFAHPSDIARDGPLREAARDRALAFFATLKAHIDRLHPRMRSGQITIAWGAVHPHAWKADIDGACLDFSSHNLARLTNTAIALDWARVEGDENTYAVMASDGDERPLLERTNHTATCTIVRATTPHHALLCLQQGSSIWRSHHATAILVCLDALDSATLEETRERARATQANIYPAASKKG